VFRTLWGNPWRFESSLRHTDKIIVISYWLVVISDWEFTIRDILATYKMLAGQLDEDPANFHLADVAKLVDAHA
jgi:hypothetical protein